LGNVVPPRSARSVRPVISRRGTQCGTGTDTASKTAASAPTRKFFWKSILSRFDRSSDRWRIVDIGCHHTLSRRYQRTLDDGQNYRTGHPAARLTKWPDRRDERLPQKPCEEPTTAPGQTAPNQAPALARQRHDRHPLNLLLPRAIEKRACPQIERTVLIVIGD
jgi:hypothetical protein